MAPTAKSTSYLTQLTTLRSFLTGMGITHTDAQLTDALRNSGYNVDVALENVLSGQCGGFGNTDHDGARDSHGAHGGASSTIPKRTPIDSTASSSVKRRKCHTGSIATGSSNKCTTAKKASSSRLLLCKRWTVACSKSVRGRVSHGEVLDFNENFNKVGNHCKNPSSTNAAASGKKNGQRINNTNHKHNKQQQNGKPKVLDPMIRFHSKSGHVEGTLNRYLCSVLSPLIRLSATNVSTNNNYNNNEFIPMVYLEGEALMEDRNIVIGSEVPISLKIYLNDPVGFFDLFSNGTAGLNGGKDSKLFFRKDDTNTTTINNNNNSHLGGSTAMPSYGKGKKMKSSFSDEELAEAAFHLLQWAEKGEEMPFVRGNVDKNEGEKKDHTDDRTKDSAFDKDGVQRKKGGVGDVKNDDEKAYSKDLEGDGDYEEESSLEPEKVNELNQLVVSDAKNENALHELSDPTGFKPGIVLRPYQRQALYWMCRREGLAVARGREDKDVGGDEELDLLAELAATTNQQHSSNDDSIQVWTGKAIACDCGPVVVGDDAVSSRATPVVDYGRDESKNKGRRYVHHPLWKRRFLATVDLGTVFAFYVNELLGVASASPPNPPKQCVGGILADAMGLGKTVMLMSLILKAKELGGGDVKPNDEVEEEKKEQEVMDISSSSDEDDDYESYHKRDEDSKLKAKKPRLSLRTAKSGGTTLVVAPLSLISQWEEEMASKTNLSSLVYYDTSSKKASCGSSFSSVDVVVTTYGTVQSEFIALSRSKVTNGDPVEPGNKQLLLSFPWERVILDEAHGIKNTTSKFRHSYFRFGVFVCTSHLTPNNFASSPTAVVSRACCMLKAKSRWAVTGTPIQNSLQDVYGLLKFLRHEPWCEATFWRNAITNALLAGALPGSTIVTDNVKAHDSPMKVNDATSEVMDIAFGRVRRVLAPIIMRRTKDTLAEDGKPILTLPPVESTIVNVMLSEPEREFYNALLERSQSVFEGYVNAGTASKSWFAIFSLLQRLRQACDHPLLTIQNRIDMSDIVDEEEHSTKDSVVTEAASEGLNDKFIEDLLSKFKRNTKDSSSYITGVANSLSQCVESKDEFLKQECIICLEEPKIEESVHTPCAHMFCQKCLLSEFQVQFQRGKKKMVNLSMFKNVNVADDLKVEGGNCPVCHKWVKLNRVIRIEKDAKSGDMVPKYLNEVVSCEKETIPKTAVLLRDKVARETLESARNGAGSSKLDAVLNELDAIWTMDPCSKVLIFSQYLGFLDIVGNALDKRNVTCFRIDGKMNLKERVKMIGRFNENVTTDKHQEVGTCQRGSVFLVSMKAGGVGLNLVAASSVFILDPWWNASVEDVSSALLLLWLLAVA
eukprot:scaffold1928_cov109-Alexandrium_tamarense.AAC.9